MAREIERRAREECAKVCEDLGTTLIYSDCADAIRAMEGQ
jgi:hypothetical protein